MRRPTPEDDSRPLRRERIRTTIPSLFRFQEGEILDLRITDLAYGGAGVARVEGFVMMVAGALPGDLVRVRVRVRKPSYAEAEVLEILERSTQRVDPRCSHFGACGGCQWMNLAYDVQLDHKERQVAEALSRIGGVRDYTLHPISRSPEIYAYRNKMEFAFGSAPEGLIAGLHRGDDPTRVEEISECHLQEAAGNRILEWVVGACRELGLTPSREGSPEGFLRRLVLRRASPEGRYLVALVTREGPFPEAPVFGRRLMEENPEVSGVVRVVVAREGEEIERLRLAGVEAIRENIAGLNLSVTSGAFLQVNPYQAARLYARVEEFAAVASRENVLDLYCGVGAITLLLARHGRRATGVEASKESVACAERNAVDNSVTRCRFIRGDARKVVESMARTGKTYDAIAVNPPRAGLPEEVAEAITRLSAKRIVYVSCNPATLARDLARVAELGYRTTDIAPFDMFPHTYHIETVARLERAA